MARAADPGAVSPTLTTVHRALGEVVAELYPEASSYVFGDAAHFEHSTQPYVVESIVKLPPGATAEREVARGPRSDGFWLHVEEREGITPYARAEGAVNRREFVEYTYYPTLKTGDGHLYIVLRLPRGHKHAEQFRSSVLKTLEAIAPANGENNSGG
ncbi:hypothetical protein [Aeoliella sp. SH292]|uniref:hypothetical protein n=1 Tax=Aeoliella sp. SH292 TaxID=3454464 RepID=UPI003F9B2AC7